MFNHLLNRFRKKPSTEDLRAAWDDKHINRHANTVKQILFGFKYIVEVNWRKIFVTNRGTDRTIPGWSPRIEFEKQYMYPSRELGDHCMVLEMRGVNHPSEIFECTEFGHDAVFVGTNNEIDATMIALKYK